MLELFYLIASVLFIVGLKMLSSPESARKGNILAGVGMTLAIVVTIFLYEYDHGGTSHKLGNYGWIFGGIVLGTIIGTMIAKKVKMTAMPQMVSLFNGMGGACAALISLNEYPHLNGSEPVTTTVSIIAGLIIGSVSFSGSMIAFGKLDGKISDPKLPILKIINLIALIAVLGLGGYVVSLDTPDITLFYIVCGIALLYGIMFVMPIGGADMPVVISLLNSFTGVAAACGGFLYDNMAMLTGGILVGSAGTFLTLLMCKAMNRSLLNVIIGSFGGSAAGASGDGGDKTIREVTPTDAAILLSYADSVVIVPGYGLAVAQAQHVCHELDKLLEEKGVNVKYAIHPVAGRMPGHMNVLLAEADVPYPKLVEMEDINPQLSNTTVAVIIGANDVVNPAAKNDPTSPIFGMPILEVEDSENIIVLKRSMNAGYAGIDNELFYNVKTKMLFGDAKDSLNELVSQIKAN
ncbi:MAG: NAD(P)(+) transhydrogenase (Re/Si-specific) subunit beta [Bacteroidia bacterium]|nr:NAD(P)(+) transhydrogenase (Re/Si-specific) subunit beta [Bacteroidia bacterium]